MTERPFLPHDLGTRNDPKMVALEMDGFPLGKAIWWDLLEMLYEQGGELPANYKSLAYILRYPTEEQVRHLVEDFDLFKVFESEDGRIFTNASAKARIQRKSDALERMREGGRNGGRAREHQATSQPQAEQGESDPSREASSHPLSHPLSHPSREASSHPSSHPQANKSNKINQINKSINQRAGAQAPAREDEEDFLMYVFFFRNLIDPVDEVGRCLENYKDTQIKNIRSVANAWSPGKSGLRFEDPRSLDLAAGIYGYIREAASPHEAVEFLRNVDAIDVDKGRNEVKIRMLGDDWPTSIQGVIDEMPSLVSTFDNWRVTRRINS